MMFVAFVAITALHIGIVMHCEPFTYDAWNVARDTDAEPFSFGRWAAYGVDQYVHSNPRVGQWATYLSYKLAGFAEVVTPLAFLALVIAVVTIGLVRLPSLRRGRDLALTVIAVGVAWFALPSIGMVMFSRAYSANYLLGAAIQLWFLAVLRQRPSGEGGLLACLGFGILGVLAGAANEHTGPTLVVFCLAYAAWRYRMGEQRPTLALAGAFGMVMGFAAIFFAPGQGERYSGLATKVSLLGRLAQRGFVNNLEIVGDFVIAIAPVLVLLAIFVVLGAHDPDREPQRKPLQRVGWALAAGALVMITLFVSPKLGPRFFLWPCAVLLASVLGVADNVLTTNKRLVPFVVIAIASSAYAAWRTVPLYYRLSLESHDRLAELDASAPGSIVTLDAFDQVDTSWWFLGDDMRFGDKRALVAKYFGLTDIAYRATDLEAPLGVSDVRIVPRVTPVADTSGFAMGATRGLDVGAVQMAALAGVRRMRTRQPSVEQVDLVVDFLGDRPALPAATLLLARWRREGTDAWAGVIERIGVTRARRVVLPPDLHGKSDYDILIYSVGHEWKRLGTAAETLTYEPWHRGAYWALACKADECFVVAATRML
ncbi:hypothetical protein BH11MYX2_BH11MYX2_03590 [soil metagenome]